MALNWAMTTIWPGPSKGDIDMAIAKASAQWNGTLKEGSGSMKGANGFFEAPFTFLSRFEGDKMERIRRS